MNEQQTIAEELKKLAINTCGTLVATAEKLDVQIRSLKNWTGGHATVPHYAVRRLTEMAKKDEAYKAEEILKIAKIPYYYEYGNVVIIRNKTMEYINTALEAAELVIDQLNDDDPVQLAYPDQESGWEEPVEIVEMEIVNPNFAQDTVYEYITAQYVPYHAVEKELAYTTRSHKYTSRLVDIINKNSFDLESAKKKQKEVIVLVAELTGYEVDDFKNAVKIEETDEVYIDIDHGDDFISEDRYRIQVDLSEIQCEYCI